MLGLSNLITNQSIVEKTTIGSFTSDFTGGSGDNSSSIVKHSVDQGTLNFTTNQSIGGQSNWLKVQYTATQTDGTSGIKIDDFVSLPGVIGDTLNFSYKIYIVNSGGLWDPEGDTDAVFTSTQLFGLSFTGNITTDQISTRSGTLIANTNYGSGQEDFVLAQFSVPDDKPQANAIFYIKDIVATVTR